MPLAIRPALPTDEEALRALDAEAWSPDVTPSPAPGPDDPFLTGDRTPDRVFVAADDAVLLGYVLIGPGHPMPSHMHVWDLRGLAVATDRRGEGIGRRLVEHAVGECARRGARRVRSQVLATNPASLAVHDACGFVVEGVARGEFVIGGVAVDNVLLAFMFDDPPAP